MASLLIRSGGPATCGCGQTALPDQPAKSLNDGVSHRPPQLPDRPKCLLRRLVYLVCTFRATAFNDPELQLRSGPRVAVTIFFGKHAINLPDATNRSQ